MKKIFLSIYILCSVLCLQAQHKLVKLWETDTILKVPESVFFDGKQLYVANIDGTQPWAKDGKGSIGRVALDGKVIAVDWVTGLHAPKGMGIYKGKLYVADITDVVVIDIAKAGIVKRIAIDSAQSLNDITIDKKGTVYVSDSKGKKVYQIKNDVPSLLVENLNRPNGLLATKNDFYVLDDGGVYKLEKNKTLSLIANGMEGGTDGVVKLGGNDLVVSCWAGAIWYVKGDGTKELLLDTQAQKINTADIDYNPAKQIIYVPTFWKNSVVAYSLQ
jgi:outer membrane protein assembly factor BamB